jgi:hypothetical protein
MVQLIHVLAEGGDVGGGSVLLDRVVVRGDDVGSSWGGGLGLACLLPRPLRLPGRDLPCSDVAEIFDELGQLAEFEGNVAIDGVVVQIDFYLRYSGCKIVKENAKDLWVRVSGDQRARGMTYAICESVPLFLCRTWSV